MYAINKSDLKTFTPDAKSVCRIEDGSTNSYLREDRAIEEFLKGIEPKYNIAISKLKSNHLDIECIYTIAGFIAYVITCSPAGMRILSNPLKGTVKETARILDSQGELPTPPPILGGETLSELLSRDKVRINIDPKFPQAIGIASILSYVSVFGNFTWEILINQYKDNPFFTSDFPVAIEKMQIPRAFNRIVPLSPYLAIRVKPDLSFDRKTIDFKFSNFRYAIRNLNRQKLRYINKLIVRCAENTVFYRDSYAWIPKFVRRNANFRIEPKTLRIPHGNGSYLWFTHEVCEITNRGN